MKEQLIRYVDLLFAGAPQAADTKQEILQNTLDRYDDLIDQGKSPEAAYRLAISGIGDINEILGEPPAPPRQEPPKTDGAPWRTPVRALAVFLFIVCPAPLFILGDEIGLCLLLVCVAVGVSLFILTGSRRQEAPAESFREEPSPRDALRRSVRFIIWSLGICFYFLLSFLTQAWYITWVVFPLTAAVRGLVTACMDLKEAKRNEP